MNAIDNTPRIWLVIGDKPGDNAQIEIIAEALGLPFEVKRVLPRPEFVLGKPRFKASLYHLDMDKSDPLQAPWPDFILTIGRRPSMAALWIGEQSGGHSKIILLGRPKKWIERFELLIVPRQYQLPPRDNVLQLDLPLMRSNETGIEQASNAWRSRFDALPRPLIALLVGGQTKPFRFDSAAAEQLISQTRAMVDAEGGTLYVSTSRRTPPKLVDLLQSRLPDNTLIYRWGVDKTEENPYLALLGLADRFIVTGDSISMMIEVARLGKPLAIFALPYQDNLATRLRLKLSAGEDNQQQGGGLIKRLGGFLKRSGIAGYGRDLTAIHRVLYERGLAVPLGEPFPAAGGSAGDELARVASTLRSVILEGRKPAH